MRQPQARQILLAIAVIAALLAVGWLVLPRENSALANAVESAAPGRSFLIIDDAKRPGDRVCVFGPYATTAQIDQALGFSWDAPPPTGIQPDDAHALVVVALDQQVTGWAMVPRDAGLRVLKHEPGIGTEYCEPRP